jgi:hypothetical protein
LSIQIVAAALVLVGCAGHAERTLDARTALDEGRPSDALALLNEALGVESGEELPPKTGGDNALLILDRSMVLLQLEQYALSSRDLQLADKQIELLDFSRSTGDEIGRYLYSDDTGPYKAPPYEKLMINTMNMVNYLVRGDLQGARVEARRLAVLQRYLASHDAPDVALTGAGSYLAGFVFEKSDRPQEALRYYDEALQYGSYASLGPTVRHLASRTSYRTPRIRSLLGPELVTPAPESPPTEPTGTEPTGTEPTGTEPTGTEPTGTEPTGTEPTGTEPTASATEPVGPGTQQAPEHAELLVVISYGRVPAKYAERVPIGLALTWSASHMSPAQSSQANHLAAQGLVTWVNYPELGRPRGRFAIPTVAVGGYPLAVEGVLAVDLESRKAWRQARGAIVSAAVTRTITRLVAGEAIRQASGDSALGLLLSLGTQATLTAADTPDTRCWSTLPARIAFSRVQLPSGTHWVDVTVRGVHKRQPITLTPGGWAVVNLTVLS